MSTTPPPQHDTGKPTLFVGEYASRNVGDGIVKLAIEKLCTTHGVAASFRDFYGGTPAPAEALHHADDLGTTAPTAADTTDDDATGVASKTISSNMADLPPAPLRAAGPAPQAPSLPRRLWRALLRVALVNYAIALLFYATRYRRIAADYQVERYKQVVIGGGNLLMDNYVNFPLLILRIVQQCERHGVPVKLFSVGAGKRYSWLGRKVVARIVQSQAVEVIICRDSNSQKLITGALNASTDIADSLEHVAEPHKSTSAASIHHKIRCSADCGLYLSRSHNPANPSDTIGLGVIAPSALQAVAPEHPMADPGYALQWWDALIGALSDHVGAEHIELISNGSGVDNDFAHALWQALAPKYPGLSVCTSIATPGDLLQRIGSYKALAAYRMHAAVTAMALEVPVIGFEWDPKVLQLFTYCGKREACIPLAEFTQRPARDIIATLLRQTPAQLTSIRQGLDRDFRHATYA